MRKRTRIAGIVVASVVVSFGAQCPFLVPPSIVGNWSLSGTFEVYSTFPSDTMMIDYEQVWTFDENGEFSMSGTMEVDQTVMTATGNGIYDHDAAAETLLVTYTTLLVDGSPQSLPDLGVATCEIAADSMTITWVADADSEPKDPFTFTKL